MDCKDVSISETILFLSDPDIPGVRSMGDLADVALAGEYINQSVTNMFHYSNIFVTNIYLDIPFYQCFGYEYIRIFVRSKILIRIYSDIRSYQFSGHKQIPTMFLFNFSGYYTLLMDILLITMVKYAI